MRITLLSILIQSLCPTAAKILISMGASVGSVMGACHVGNHGVRRGGRYGESPTRRYTSFHTSGANIWFSPPRRKSYRPTGAECNVRSFCQGCTFTAAEGAGVSLCSILLEAGRDFCDPSLAGSDVGFPCGCSSLQDTVLCAAPTPVFVLSLDLSPFTLACQVICQIEAMQPTSLRSNGMLHTEVWQICYLGRSFSIDYPLQHTACVSKNAQKKHISSDLQHTECDTDDDQEKHSRLPLCKC